MFIRRFIVGSLAVLSVWFSFADFQSELDDCKFNESCRVKIMKKYMISKSSACNMKDWKYKKPIQISRPKMKINNTSFQKKEKMLFYSFDLYTGTYEQYMSKSDFWPQNQRFFSYNCETKKPFNITEKVANNKEIVRNGFGVINNAIWFNNDYLFVHYFVYESANYSLINLKTGKTNILWDVINKSQWLEKLYDKYKELFDEKKQIRYGTEWYEGIYPIINSINKKMILDFGFKKSWWQWDDITIVPSIKIDLVNNKILSFK